MANFNVKDAKNIVDAFLSGASAIEVFEQTISGTHVGKKLSEMFSSSAYTDAEKFKKLVNEIDREVNRLDQSKKRIREQKNSSKKISVINEQIEDLNKYRREFLEISKLEQANDRAKITALRKIETKESDIFKQRKERYDIEAKKIDDMFRKHKLYTTKGLKKDFDIIRDPTASDTSRYEAKARLQQVINERLVRKTKRLNKLKKDKLETERKELAIKRKNEQLEERTYKLNLKLKNIGLHQNSDLIKELAIVRNIDSSTKQRLDAENRIKLAINGRKKELANEAIIARKTKKEAESRALVEAGKDSAKRRGTFLSKFKSRASFVATARIAYGTMDLINNLIRGSISLVLDLEDSTKRVLSLFIDKSPRVERMISKGLAESMAKFNIELKEATDALYNIVSAQIPENSVLGVLSSAGVLSKAIGSNIEESAKLLTTVINSYNMDPDAVGNVADMVAETQRIGRTTGSELTKAFEKLVPVAEAVGIPFGELTATLATLTKNGMSTAMASTSLRQAIQTLTKPTEKTKKLLADYGITLTATELKENGLLKTIAKLTPVINDERFAIAKSRTGRAALLSTMSNLNEAFEDQNTILNSSGKALEMYETRMSSTKEITMKMLGSFKAAWAEMLKDSWIQRGINSIAERLTDFFNTSVFFADNYNFSKIKNSSDAENAVKEIQKEYSGLLEKTGSEINLTDELSLKLKALNTLYGFDVKINKQQTFNDKLKEELNIYKEKINLNANIERRSQLSTQLHSINSRKLNWVRYFQEKGYDRDMIKGLNEWSPLIGDKEILKYSRKEDTFIKSKSIYKGAPSRPIGLSDTEVDQIMKVLDEITSLNKSIDEAKTKKVSSKVNTGIDKIESKFSEYQRMRPISTKGLASTGLGISDLESQLEGREGFKKEALGKLSSIAQDIDIEEYMKQEESAVSLYNKLDEETKESFDTLYGIFLKANSDSKILESEISKAKLAQSTQIFQLTDFAGNKDKIIESVNDLLNADDELSTGTKEAIAEGLKGGSDTDSIIDGIMRTIVGDGNRSGTEKYQEQLSAATKLLGVIRGKLSEEIKDTGKLILSWTEELKFNEIKKSLENLDFTDITEEGFKTLSSKYIESGFPQMNKKGIDTLVDRTKPVFISGKQAKPQVKNDLIVAALSGQDAPTHPSSFADATSDEKRSMIVDTTQETIKGLNEAWGLYYEYQQLAIQNELQARLDALEELKNAEIDTVNTSIMTEEHRRHELATINNKYNKKREKAEEKAREKQAKLTKKKAIADIAISLATSIMGIWAKWQEPWIAVPLTAMVTGLHAAQLAIINKTKYAKGGLVSGNSHENGGIPMISNNGNYIGEMEGGEFIFSKKATKGRENLLAALNNQWTNGSSIGANISAATQGTYANGGVVSVNQSNYEISDLITAISNMSVVQLNEVTNTGIYRASKLGEYEDNDI